MRAFLAALLAVWTLAGCQPTAARDGEPALWRIADADSEIWLFGSVHMLPPDLDWRGPRVDAAFAAADEFVTETDLPGPESAAAFEAFRQRHGMLPPGQTLSARLSQSEAAQLRRAAQELGLDANALDRQRAWLTAIQLSYADLARSGQSAEAGVENVLAAEARRQGKRFSALETLDEQLSVLATLPPEAEARFLTVALGEIGSSDELAAEMDRAWAAGDTAALEQMFEEQWRAAGAEVHEAVILQRNRAWAVEIERRLAGSGRTFIAVGAAHLIGDDSVVDLLRARGIAVEGP
jgi:uncharacterized protein YbaP (TraB family)